MERAEPEGEEEDGFKLEVILIMSQSQSWSVFL